MKISSLIRSALVTSMLGASIAHAEQGVGRRFSLEISRGLIGAHAEFVPVALGRGDRGFLLAQVGSSAAPISEAYSGIQGDFTQSLADAMVFDKPVTSAEGVAILGGDRLSGIWREILDQSRPGFSLSRDRALDERTMKWLFRQNPGKRPANEKYSREPSNYYLRYQEFQKNYSLLLSARTGDVWRSLPAFRRFATFDEAERNLLAEWFKSGYKAEIESAMWRFSSSVPFVQWQAWAEANSQFESNMVPYAQYIDLPVTRLFPPPSSWSSVSMWFRGTSRDGIGNGEYRFQYARVRISRPWMDLEALLSGKIRIQQGNSADFLVSDGAQATYGALPKGLLGGFIEEIVLVRNITHSGESAMAIDDHPLGAYAYPDAINILGYIVRTLPKIPPNDDTEVARQQ